MAFFKYPKVNSFLDMNSCRSQPCQNGGQCHNQGTSYNCQCAPGYYGNHCEHGKCWPDMVDFNQTGYIGCPIRRKELYPSFHAFSRNSREYKKVTDG